MILIPFRARNFNALAALKRAVYINPRAFGAALKI